MSGHFHDDSIGDVAAALRTDLDRGLSPDEARARLLRLGPNAIAEDAGSSRLDILRGQLLSPMVGVLLVAAVLSAVLREWIDFGVILAIVVLNAAVGFYQEHRAERSLQMLRKLAAPRARAIRGGASTSVATAELVPGDLVELEPGDLVPADSRVVRAIALRTDESALTGESTPVEKRVEPTAGPHVELGDRASCVYTATTVAAGRGRAIVFGTGADTELGKIATLVRGAVRDATPLQKELGSLSRWLLAVCGLAILAVFAVGMLRGLSPSGMFLTAVSLAVAAIPEGLPAIVTITLAIGVQRMLKRHVLLRRLSSVETLGCASVICADKTGTITRNEMSVRAALVGGGAEVALEDAALAPDAGLRELLGAAAACSNVRDDGIASDPTEAALVAAARRAGWTGEELGERYPRLAESPFDAERRRMSTLHGAAGGPRVLFVKGAHEVVLERCTRVRDAGGDAPLDGARLRAIDASSRRFAERGMRVLAVAERRLDGGASGDPRSFERDLTLLGLVAMADPPRPEAAAAVARCTAAGIRTVMLTGDHAVTAQAIAREVGVLRDGDRVMTGAELAELSDEALAGEVERVAVYARLAPDQKLKIVKAWKSRGAVVAMTGDGVNDAPAIKAADVGVALGKTGTDVAREAADLVVTDDNFASIVSAVEEGRGVHANIRRALLCLFAGNLSEVAVVGIATALGLPVPLHPSQILWMNLVTDGPPALALATEPVSDDAMQRPPRDRRARLLDPETIANVVYQGFVLYLGAMLALLYFYDGGRGGPAFADVRMQTGVFCTVVVSQMLNAFSFRDDRRSIFTTGVRGNLRLLVAVLVSIALQVAIVQWRGGRAIFHTTALAREDWAAIGAFSLLPVLLVEIRKAWRRRQSPSSAFTDGSIASAQIR